MQKNGGSFWVRMIKGMVIGVAAMLPGASGGVLAVSMGVYKPVIDAVTSIFKSFIKSVKYLLPLGIGGLMGLFGTGRAVEALLASFKISVMWALIGMVLGGLPSLIKEANQRGFKARYLLGSLLGIAIIGVAIMPVKKPFCSSYKQSYHGKRPRSGAEQLRNIERV